MNLSQKVFDLLFEMPTMENKQANTPICKRKMTRKKGFNLLITLCKKHTENYIILLKNLYIHHDEMKQIGVQTDEYDQTIGIKSTVGYVGLKNYGCTCYMNSLM